MVYRFVVEYLILCIFNKIPKFFYLFHNFNTVLGNLFKLGKMFCTKVDYIPVKNIIGVVKKSHPGKGVCHDLSNRVAKSWTVTGIGFLLDRRLESVTTFCFSIKTKRIHTYNSDRQFLKHLDKIRNQQYTTLKKWQCHDIAHKERIPKMYNMMSLHQTESKYEHPCTKQACYGKQ